MRPLVVQLVPLAVTGLVVAGCGDERAATTDPSGAGSGQQYTATATVLESPEHGPQLCLGGVAESLPPQCGGPDIVGWSWDDVDDFESASGTTWGAYTVVGTYDGEAFRLTEPPQPAVEPEIPDSPQFWTPCDEPTGGWAVVDEDTATDEAMNEAIAYAEAQADHAGTWLDQSINPALADEADLSPEDMEAVANDPTKLVLNFRFTGDVDRHEQQLREIWGGALCVSAAEHTMAGLQEIQLQIHDDYGTDILGSGIDTEIGYVELMVALDDGSLQRELDERYGEGLVRVYSALQPVD